MKATKSFIITVALLALIPYCLSAGDAFLKPRDHKREIELLQTAAEQGNIVSQFQLGLCYRDGTGVPQNFKESLKWFRKSADSGYAMAQFTLGNMYSKGERVPKNYQEAVKWYLKAVAQGDEGAQTNLGNMYERGEGVPQNYTEAIRLLQLAADQGEAGAQYGLAEIFEQGKGVSQDLVKAHMWFNLSSTGGIGRAGRQRDEIAKHLSPEMVAEAQRQAREKLAEIETKYATKNVLVGWRIKELKTLLLEAESGSVQAEYTLGDKYLRGDFFPQDFSEAYFWLNLAASQDPNLASRRDEIRAKLPSQKLEEVQARCKKWTEELKERKAAEKK